MKPLGPEVHQVLAQWVRNGGSLVVVDDGQDPYNRVREWWNTGHRKYASPLAHLLEQLGLPNFDSQDLSWPLKCGQGRVTWLKTNPEDLAAMPEGDSRLTQSLRPAAEAIGLKWREASSLVLRRGPYVIAAGLDESVPGELKTLTGNFVNLFDAGLRVSRTVRLTPGSRFFLLDLDKIRGRQPRGIASACKALPTKSSRDELSLVVEGVGDTPAVVLLHSPKPPRSITLAGEPIFTFEYSEKDRLLWVHFLNRTSPRELRVKTGAN
jgi:hypothetical protein